MAARETIQVIREGAGRPTDPLDGPGTAAAPRNVPGCTVVPLMHSGEETFQGQVVDADFFVKAPAGTDILATDEVVIRGEQCEVEGAPADYGRKGVLFQAKRVGTI